MPLIVTKDRVAEMLSDVRSLAKNAVYVGIPAEDASEERDGKPINLAAIGYIQETGSPSTNLPARPFLLPGVKAVRERAVAVLKQGARDVLNGKPGAADDALSKVGQIATAAVQKVISDSIPPPIAPRTAIARLTRTATGKAAYRRATPEERRAMVAEKIETATPLHDTGGLVRAIRHVVRKG